MRKSKIECDIDRIRVDCEKERSEFQHKICDSLNCSCARTVIAEWTGRVYNDYFGSEPVLFCTLYLKKDVILWNKLKSVRIRNIKARFTRFLKRVGLGNVKIMGVLDAALIAKVGFLGNPQPKWHFHWHFFIRKRDLTEQVIQNIKKRMKNEDSGIRPFLAKTVNTFGFWTTYLWKSPEIFPRRLQKPDKRLITNKRGYVNGRYLGQLEAFMIDNPGLSWLFLQGLRRSSGRIIEKTCQTRD